MEGSGNSEVDRAVSLEDDESLLLEGQAARNGSALGGRMNGPLWITSKRLIWWGPGLLGFGRQHMELRLSEIESVDKGSIWDWIGGGTRLRIRLKNGKVHKLFPDAFPAEVDHWISELRSAIRRAG